MPSDNLPKLRFVGMRDDRMRMVLLVACEG